MEEVAKKGGTNQVLRKQHQRRERGKEVAGFLGIRSDGRLKSIWLIESSALPEVWGQRTGVISPSRHTHDHRARPLRPPSASRRQELQLGDWPTIRKSDVAVGYMELLVPPVAQLVEVGTNTCQGLLGDSLRGHQLALLGSERCLEAFPRGAKQHTSPYKGTTTLRYGAAEVGL